MTRASAEPVLELGAMLGEGPIWDVREQRLLFVDILGERVHWFYPERGTHHSFVAGGPVGAVVLSEDGGLVLARHDCFVRTGPSGEGPPSSKASAPTATPCASTMARSTLGAGSWPAPWTGESKRP